MAHVRIVTPEEATGRLEEALEARGWVCNIVSSSSVRPSLVESFFSHYANVMNSPDSGLTPAERQMVATVTSAANHCQY